MKDKIFSGIYCYSAPQKCPYALKFSKDAGPWFCGFYSETLQSEGPGPDKVLRCPTCVRRSSFTGR